MAMGSSTGTGPAPGSNTLRTIATGVITTVTAAALIYFLGFHPGSKKSGDDFLQTKEATSRCWRSFVTTENLFTANWQLFNSHYTPEKFSRYRQSVLDELKRYRADLDELSRSKNIDPSLHSLLERRKESQGYFEERYRSHLERFESILRSGDTGTALNTRLRVEVERFAGEIQDKQQKFANEIGEICSTLSAKYALSFSPAELKQFQPGTVQPPVADGGLAQRLQGDWQVYFNGNPVGRLQLYPGNVMRYYYAAGDSTWGRWDASDGGFHLYYDQFWGAVNQFHYTLSDITDRGFAYTLNLPPNDRFTTQRIH